MYLTVDECGRVRLWCGGSPVYFADGGEWARPRLYCAISSSQSLGGWPDLIGYAESLGLEPGPEGIAKVVIEMRAADAEG